MEIQTRTFEAFNTINTVQVYDKEDARAALDAVCAEAARFETLFSHTLPQSSLMRINSAGGKPVDVEPELAELIAASLGFCETSGGLFDITIVPVVELWRTGAHQGGSCTVPSTEALNEALSHVDYRGVSVQGSTVQLQDPQASIVLGGIAKGYIADALCALLQHHGIQHAIVNLGGNVKVFGGKLDESDTIVPFTVGLHVPRADSEAPNKAFAAVQIADGSVVTSGIYERGVRTSDGNFYHHILDTHTGMPVQTDLVSVSLISATSLEGDGYTTALIAMGLDRASAFVEQLPGCEAVFVTMNNSVHTSSGIGKTIPFKLL